LASSVKSDEEVQLERVRRELLEHGGPHGALGVAPADQIYSPFEAAQQRVVRGSKTTGKPKGGKTTKKGAKGGSTTKKGKGGKTTGKPKKGGTTKKGGKGKGTTKKSKGKSEDSTDTTPRSDDVGDTTPDS